jgi:hypothetical protein
MFAYVRLMGEKMLRALRAATMPNGERPEATEGVKSKAEGRMQNAE